MLRVITYNCYNIKNSIQDICDLCKSDGLIIIQEIWLFQHNIRVRYVKKNKKKQTKKQKNKKTKDFIINHIKQ